MSASSWLDSADPGAQFRSIKDPQLNEATRSAEILLRLHQSGLAAEVLDWVAARMSGAETSYQLYVAVLLGRAGDNIGQFHALADLFREDPTTISRETLELFYPLHRYNTLMAHAQQVDPLLLAALIRQESGFNAAARSPVGALGLMQLMPRTARRWQRHLSRRALFNPQVNIRIGARYFERLLDRFDWDAALALAAYNAGADKVEQWRERYPTPDRLLMLDLIPYKETRNYVALIARNYYWYLSLYGNRDLRLLDRLDSGGGRIPASSTPAQTRRPINLRSGDHLLFTLFSSLPPV